MASPDSDLEQQHSVAQVETYELSRAIPRTEVALERTVSVRSIRETVSPAAARIPVEFHTLSLHVDTIEAKGDWTTPQEPKTTGRNNRVAVKGLSKCSISHHTP